MSTWCHPIVIVDKRDSSEKQLTVDLRKLNDQVCRPAHPVCTPRDALASVSHGKYFSKLDARHGYWQIPLSDTAKPLTTFITPWGRYRYCRNPQGLVSAGDVFNQRTDAAFSGLTHFVKVVDDGLVYDDDFNTHVTHVRDVLQRARSHGITLSADKFVFGADEVQFCGYIVNSDGFTVDGSQTSAIRDFPVPSNRTDLRSFLGLANQCSAFCPRLSELSGPLRPLLKTSNEFLWDANHTAAFDDLKSVLTSSPVLSFFQPGLPLRLETDASVKNGLGYALWQLQTGHWRLIQCGSRFLSDAETRYAVIELECLAVAWAAHKCSLYLLGTSFEVITDHRPLIPILNSQSLDQIENPRLQRLALKLRAYQLRVLWRKGTEQAFSDALSRHPVTDPTPDDEFGECPGLPSLSVRICVLSSDDGSNGSTSLRFHEVQSAALADSDYQRLCKYVSEGFPSSKSKLPPSLQPYWNGREHLSVDGDIVLKGQRIVIPPALRSRVLSDLHASHQGLTCTKQRARQIVYWPGLTVELEQVVRSCPECRYHGASQQKEPLLSENRDPDLPFQHTSADLFECQGWQFLVYVDRKAGWPCVAKIGRSATSNDVVRCLRRWFPDIGVPEVLTTDGGPQFSSHHFANFCSRWQIQHVMSSPHYPRSNGLAESAVKAIKTLILKTTSNGDLDVDAFQRALLEWRNTPRTSSGTSPAQALFGRPLSSFVFAHRSSFAPEWQTKSCEADSLSAEYAAKVKLHYDKSARPLPPLSLGTHIDLQDPRSKSWSSHGIVVAIGRHRDYAVKLPSGRVLWRNRRFLRARVSPVPVPAGPTSHQGDDKPPADDSGSDEPSSPPPRRSTRHRRRHVPFNIVSTRGQSYA